MWSQSMSPEEERVVEELKRRVLSEMTDKMLEDESIFYRFCKARDFKLEDAEAMLRKHMKWRKEARVETISEEYKFPEATKYIPTSFLGYDKEGCLVRYIDFGDADIKGIFQSIKQTDFCKFCLQALEKDRERQKQHCQKLGRCQVKLTYVLNFKGLTFAKATNRDFLESMIQIASWYQDNYPEVINKVLFINVSVYFAVGFPVIKTVIAPALLKKMRFYGAEGYQEDLLEIIEADDLPAFLGGNRTDPDGDPLCPSFVNHGKKVPKRLYLRQSEKKLSKEPDVEKLTVTRFSKEERCFEVKEPGSHLEWEFETKTKDIGFAIYYLEETAAESQPVELIPKQRIDTSYEPEKGLFKCEKPGKYIIVFDNSYSWIYPKEVYYRARVKAPRDNSELCN